MVCKFDIVENDSSLSYKHTYVIIICWYMAKLMYVTLILFLNEFQSWFEYFVRPVSINVVPVRSRYTGFIAFQAICLNFPVKHI